MMKTRPIAIALLLTLTPATFSFTFVRPAAAQGDDATTKAARARFQEGVEFYDKKQYEHARASFLQAYALRKHPAVLLNLAQSSLRSGHTLEAARYFQQYLRESPSITAQQRNDAERGLVEARTKLGRIEVDAVAGADIFVDDERVGTAPLRDPVDVEPGSHAVKSRGRTEEITSLTVSAGQTATAHLTPQAATATPVPVPLPVTTPSTPPSPPAKDETPPTKETPSETSTTPVQPSSSSASSDAPPKRGDRIMAPFWIGIGVTVAAGATAIAMGIAKSSAQSSADAVTSKISENLTPQQARDGGICLSTAPADVKKFGNACAALADDQNKVNADATVGNIAIGVAAAAAVFSVMWLIVGPRREAESAKSAPVVTPIVGPGIGGLNVGGAF